VKKYLFLSILILLPLILAGCSLVPANEKASNAPADQTKSTGSLWQSVDGGKVWIDKSVGVAQRIDTSSADILTLAVNPYGANTAYAGVRGAGILKTEDGGQSWQFLPFQSEKVYGLDIDPVDSKIIYASGVWQKRGKIFKSLDGGKTWGEIYTSPSAGPLIIALQIDKKNSNVVYAATSDNQVIKTTDGGGSWKNIFAAPGPVTKISIDKADSSLVYLATPGRGVFKSSDGGKNFEDISKDFSRLLLGSQDINVLETDPQNTNWVYVAGGMGILRSKDAGKKWDKIEVLNNPSTFPVKSLAINPKNSSEIIYGAAQAVYKSIDGGANWATTQFETGKSINNLKYSAANPEIIYLGLSK
jgi:photosystem II stability/assembly factor-like uncharacterized protein